MAQVAVAETLEGTVHEAETLWCEARRWPEWVDECERVLSVSDGWPAAGSEVVWQSGPAGRGRVVERVIEHEPLQALVLEVQDDSIAATQRVAFDPAAEGVEVTLSLDYRLRERSFFASLGGFFIRRAMRTSLQSTLGRFGAELATQRGILG